MNQTEVSSLFSLLNFMAQFTVVFLTAWYFASALQVRVLDVGKVMTAFAVTTFSSVR